MHGSGFLLSLVLASSTLAQHIQDVYYTSWNQSSLFAYQKTPSPPVAFGTPGPVAQASITINETNVYQPMDGFGATLTDTAAATLLSLKTANSNNYWQLLRKMFDRNDASNAGLSYLRVSLGASDLSPFPYNFDQTPGDAFLLHFSLSNASNVLAVIRDIRLVSPLVKVHLIPWSTPAWMKSDATPTLYGGTFDSKYTKLYAGFLLKAALGFELATGGPAYAIGIQNEPENSNPTYPTCLMSPDDMGNVGLELRSLMNVAGLGSTKIIGFEHNWVNASSYPVQLIQNYGSAFAGVAFHCYGGSYQDQAAFTSQFPDKEVYFTECTGTIGSDFWGDIKWWNDNLFIGAVSYRARTALMWNLAAHSDGSTLLPGTTSCGGGTSPGCRPVVNIEGGTYSFNQEFYALAQAQRATLPTSIIAPEANLIGSSLGGDLNWALRVNAYMAKGPFPGEDRFSLVVLNWYDNASPGPVNPIAVTTSINFRNLQANYTFPVGVTTLSWYASANGVAARDVTVFTEPLDLASGEAVDVLEQHGAAAENISSRRTVATVQIKNIRNKHSRLASHH